MTIDVHAHLTGDGVLPNALDVGRHVAERFDAGIEMAFVAELPKSAHAGTPLIYDELAELYSSIAEIVAAHHPHLRAYAYVDPFADAACLQLAADTVAQEAFVGLVATTSVRGEYLSSERAEDFFAMAAAADVPLLLHASPRPVGADVLPERLVPTVGAMGDVTTGLAAFVFAGWLERYPELVVIAGGGAGAVGLVAGRLDTAFKPLHWRGGADGGPPGGGPPGGGPPGGGPPGGDPPGEGALPPWLRYENKISTPPSDQLRRLHVDTAVESTAHLRAGLAMVGTGGLVFASGSADAATATRRVHAVREVAGEGADAVLHGNAAALFRLEAKGSS